MKDDSARLVRLAFWLNITAACILLLHAFAAAPPTSTVLFAFGIALIYNAVRVSIDYHRARRRDPP